MTPLRMPLPHAPEERGFTLLELLAAILVISVLAGFAIPKLESILLRVKIVRAIGDIEAIQTDLMAIEVGNQPLPADLSGIGRAGMLDPWGRPYVYQPFDTTAHGVPPGARRDRFLVPLNSTFDLYSIGPDGRSVPPLSGPGADDIVRANDGGFIGLGSQF